MSRLEQELLRVFGDPLVAPRAVLRTQVGSGQGVDAAREEADRMVDAGADLVVLDTDVTTPGSLVALAALLDLDPVAVVGTTPSDTWRDEVLAVRTGLRAARPLVGDPAALLDALDDPLLARVAGLLERLADRRTAVLVGGGTAAAAGALLASRLRPGSERWWLAGTMPGHPVAVQAWRSMGLEPLLDLGPLSVDVAAALVRAGLEELGA
jgi:nicotinate-nucleotide--dimethylbenzimidazole phosphoribosyltransferase